MDYTSGWESVVASSAGAAVYLDTTAVELCRLSGIQTKLWEAGALSIQNLGKVQGRCKVEGGICVVVCGRFWSIEHYQKVRHFLSSGNYKHYVVYISTREDVLVHCDIPCDSYSDLQVKLLQEARKSKMAMDSRVNVRHFAVLGAAISSDLVITPGFSSLFPLLPTDVPQLQLAAQMKGLQKEIKSLHDLEIHLLPETLQVQLRVFVSQLNDFFSQLDIGEDCYAVGSMSKVIAAELANLSSAKSRRKNASHKASLILIDRSLDLAGPVSHTSDCLADQISRLLPPLHETSSDVYVDMSETFSQPRHSVDALAPGTLYHPDSPLAQGLLNSFILKRQKEAVMETSRVLLDCLAKELIETESAMRVGRMTPEKIKGFIKEFSGRPKIMAKYGGLVQCAVAAISALESSHCAHMERLLSVEKVLLLSLGEEGAVSAVRTLCDLFNQKRQDMNLSIEDIILLAVFAYSFAETKTDDDEDGQLKGLIASLINSQPSHVAEAFVDSNRTVDQKLDSLFKKLHCLHELRSQFRQFGSLYCQRLHHTTKTYVPLVKQVVEAVLNPNKLDLPDVEYQSHGLRDYLKTGFSLLTNIGKAHPGNHRILFLFIVGGVTFLELRHIREVVVAAGADKQVVVCSTRVIRARDVYRQLVNCDNLSPAAS
ncbi:sec1 family domain-containing protein 2-like [Corticium candelabrum]|uniref:sec1 family domain-containing protein 2-like n=1 Tax=Corticium candelabrum TaxID=121492 RepID=UPI002E33327F|nr:sec1 family domain-containing protein 2-like [Corticium candelabrum]